VASVCFVFSGYAQQKLIAVVSSAGITTLYSDLDTAIPEAATGSVIYLPGGFFPINDATKINKKLTIIGIGHKADNGLADHYTQINGNLFFEEDSDGSTLLGVYLTGNLNIGTAASAVNNFLLRYCNINSVQVKNNNCQNILINQNYIRNASNGGNSPVFFTNNIMHSLVGINGGSIIHNLLLAHTFAYLSGSCPGCYGGGCTCSYYCTLVSINFSQIKNNIFPTVSSTYYNIAYSIENCEVFNNAAPASFGNDCIVVSDWSTVFVGPQNGITPTSNYHLQDGPWKTGATDGGEVGIYGGGGFSDSQLPPVPRITYKEVANETDEDGKLKVKIKVEAQ
jgi:hypothetical protein